MSEHRKRAAAPHDEEPPPKRKTDPTNTDLTFGNNMALADDTDTNEMWVPGAVPPPTTTQPQPTPTITRIFTHASEDFFEMMAIFTNTELITDSKGKGQYLLTGAEVNKLFQLPASSTAEEDGLDLPRIRMAYRLKGLARLASTKQFTVSLMTWVLPMEHDKSAELYVALLRAFDIDVSWVSTQFPSVGSKKVSRTDKFGMQECAKQMIVAKIVGDGSMESVVRLSMAKQRALYQPKDSREAPRSNRPSQLAFHVTDSAAVARANDSAADAKQQFCQGGPLNAPRHCVPLPRNETPDLERHPAPTGS